jgi:hypothetical protein
VLLLRQARAEALLTLLRHWTQTGTLALESADQDQLQREVNSVLQTSAWDTFFRLTSARDSSSSPIRRVSVHKRAPSALAAVTAGIRAWLHSSSSLVCPVAAAHLWQPPSYYACIHNPS